MFTKMWRQTISLSVWWNNALDASDLSMCITAFTLCYQCLTCSLSTRSKQI